MTLFDKIKKAIKSSYLCIRFPFFYPRNRFSGHHYNNWKLIEKYRKYNNQHKQIMSVHLCNRTYIDTLSDTDKKSFQKLINNEGYEYLIKPVQHGIYIETWQGTSNRVTTYIPKEKFMKNTSYNEEEILQNGKIIDAYFEVSEYNKKYPYQKDTPRYSYTICVVTDCENKKEDPVIEFKAMVDIIKDPFAKYISKFYSVLERILSISHFIPTYTELDSMPKGWRKAFGIQMFKEIKHSLLTTYIREENVTVKTPIKYIKAWMKGVKLLYDFRIMDIKEKFSTLRVYVASAPMDVYHIINKYEGISYNTCITCGKPAVWRTTGWICPYCDDCLSDDEKLMAEKIGEDNNDRETEYTDTVAE